MEESLVGRGACMCVCVFGVYRGLCGQGVGMSVCVCMRNAHMCVCAIAHACVCGFE